MQIRPVLGTAIARAADLGAQALCGATGLTFLGALYLSDLRDRLTAPAINTGQNLRDRAARFATAGTQRLVSVLRPQAAPAAQASQQAQAKDSKFYDPSLHNLFPLEGDLRYASHSTAGLIVSYRGTPEIWTGATADIVSAIPRRRADGTLVPHVIGQVAQMGDAEALEALKTAKASWKKGEWRNMNLTERSLKLNEALEEVGANREKIVDLLMHEIGKTKADAESEFDRTMEYMKDVLIMAQEIEGESNQRHYSQEHNKHYRKFLTATGIALVMGPSNYPWNEGFGTTAFPALVAGNSIIYKAPRAGQLCLQTVLYCFANHLPEGVLNVISGDGKVIIKPIMESGDINLLYFVGSEKVGNAVVKMHPKPKKLKTFLGLGSKNPMIVLKGADIQKTAALAEKGGLGNRGERCTGTSLVLAHTSDAEALAKALATEVEKRVAGNPWNNGVSDSPFADSGKWRWMEELVKDAVAKGARIMNRGGGTHNGHIYIPAVLYPITANMKIANEEVFGPVMGIMPYDDLDKVVAHLRTLSEDHDLNQQASVITADGETAPESLLNKLWQLYAAIQINAIPKRYDGTPVIPFSARHENPLGGARVALEGAGVMVYQYEEP